MKKLLILKTGNTVEPLQQIGEDFEDWIIAGSGVAPNLYQTVNVFEGEQLPQLSHVHGIYVTGSPDYVTDLAQWSEQTAAYLKTAATNSVPILGICYGHQLLAHSFGGKVDFHPQGREIGTVSVMLTDSAEDDPLLGKIPATFLAQVSHQQSVLRLPANALRLAFNEFEANHAFRIGDCAWGIQFHPEFSADVMAAYIKHRRQSIEDEGMDVESLLRNIKQTPVATILLQEFAKLCLHD